jgi:hypothetical protein
MWATLGFLVVAGVVFGFRYRAITALTPAPNQRLRAVAAQALGYRSVTDITPPPSLPVESVVPASPATPPAAVNSACLASGQGHDRLSLPATPPAPVNSACRSSGEAKLLLTALVVSLLGAVVCLSWGAWRYFFPHPVRLSPSDSSLAKAEVKEVCFSADGQALAVVLKSGALALYDTVTGNETGRWVMPNDVDRPAFAPDGRHLLGLSSEKAYVIRLKPFDEAAYVLARCEAVEKKDPHLADALLDRGELRLRQHRPREALADFTKALRLDPKSARAYYQRGLAHTDTGDYVRALEDFDQALRLGPKLAARTAQKKNQP